MFKKVLIANRGEITVRIIRTCRALGIATVAVYSDVDAQALHVLEADEAVPIGPAPVAQSYLNIEAIIGAARRTGAQAIHPGYGLLAENPLLAEACQEAGITFVGPPSQAMRAMAHKAHARRLAASLGIPVVPGHDSIPLDSPSLLKAARELGFPLLIKAAAGGGGRGMRLVEKEEDLLPALESAHREAQSAFGDGYLLMEKLIPYARHVEIQVVADSYGCVVHLGERDCSLQRRHQKVMEEAPSPVVDDALRHRLGEAAISLAKAIGYRNLGTVEFLLDEEGHFYFLEMNTRLQVEHGVTELVTGLDLVALQLAIAAGHPLPLKQEDVRLRGHALECRIYAEDPSQGFLPRSGRINVFQPPQGEGIRNDVGVYPGALVPPYYDPLLAKLLTWGQDRQEALSRMAWALDHYRLEGITTNLPFLQAMVRHPAVQRGKVTVRLVEELDVPSLLQPPPQALMALVAALAIGALDLADPWEALGPWRPGGTTEITVEHEGRTYRALAQRLTGGRWRLSSGSHALEGRLFSPIRGRIVVEGQEGTWSAQVERQNRSFIVEVAGRSWRFQWASPIQVSRPRSPLAKGEELLRAPLNGIVVRVLAQEGDRVKAHQVLVIIESMKMEHNVETSSPGLVRRVLCQPGDQVEEGQVLVELELTEGES